MNFTVLCKIKANDIISITETPGSEILKVTVNTCNFWRGKKKKKKTRKTTLLRKYAT